MNNPLDRLDRNKVTLDKINQIILAASDRDLTEAEASEVEQLTDSLEHE
ncbi:MAG: hypothetical protein M0Q93_00405 [Terrimicrobiaceae bacterium]|nr:hypothetical protein [Terrimicrobiaceae bacterium]